MAERNLLDHPSFAPLGMPQKTLRLLLGLHERPYGTPRDKTLGDGRTIRSALTRGLAAGFDRFTLTRAGRAVVGAYFQGWLAGRHYAEKQSTKDRATCYFLGHRDTVTRLVHAFLAEKYEALGRPAPAVRIDPETDEDKHTYTPLNWRFAPYRYTGDQHGRVRMDLQIEWAGPWPEEDCRG